MGMLTTYFDVIYKAVMFTLATTLLPGGVQQQQYVNSG
jgi:hypothetical protein